MIFLAKTPWELHKTINWRNEHDENEGRNHPMYGGRSL